MRIGTDATRSTTTQIELVGAPRLVLGDSTIHPLERKDAALLALLAIDGPLPRGRAASLLWPDVDGDAARNNLRQRLHRLRRRAGHDLVVTDRDVLQLAPQAQTEVHAHDPAAPGSAPADLLGAFDYDDCEELREWVASARARLRNDRRNALADAAARLEHDGQIAQALHLADQLLADDALLEHAHRRVMRLHYLRGDRSAALAAFQRCRTVLAEQLHALPGRETLELATLIEKSQPLPSPLAGAPRPVAVLRPPRLVGRGTELRALEQAWWQQRVALLLGEPGVGKSRLLGEFAGAHGGLLVGARPGDTRVPYATLARLLRVLYERGALTQETWAQRELARIVPEFDREWIATGDTSAARLAHAVELQLAATRDAAAQGAQPLSGVVLDDLQFADAESVGVLALVVRSDTLSLAWLFGARGHELPAVARPWVNAADAASIVQVPLRPLDEAGTRELLRSLELTEVDADRWATSVYRHTGGNPMFVLETLGALLAADDSVRAAVRSVGHPLPIPDNVGQLIEARLANLGAAALRLARVAALADKDFSVELAAAVLGTHVLDLAEPWRELVDAQVIRDEAFAHDLVLEATRRSIPPALAQSIHATLAKCLTQHAAAPERVARHWFAAAAWPEAADAFLQAAEGALALSRRADELRLLRAAADCRARARNAAAKTPPNARAEFEIELRSARASLLIDRTDAARGYAHAALALATSDMERAEALAVCAETEEFIGEFDTAIAHATEGLALALQRDDAPLALTHAAHLGRVFAMRGEFERGCAMFDAHASRIDAAPESTAARAFLMHQAVVLDHARRRDQAVVAGQRALRLAEAAHDESSVCLCHIHLTSFYARMGAGPEAFEHATRAVQLREQIGQAGGQTEVAELYLGVLSTSLGRFSQTLELLDMAQQRLVHGRAVSWAVMARGVLARTWVLLGQPARGLKLLTDEVPGVTESVRGLRLVNLVRVLRALGKPRAQELAEARAMFARQSLHEGDLLVRLEEALDAPPAQAAVFAGEVEAEAARRQHRALQLDAMTIGCNALLGAGAIADAAAKARTMLRFAETAICWTTYRGEMFWRAYEALAAAGHDVEALQALQQGAAWIDATLAFVPEAFRDSFLHRNPVNRAVLTTASRKLPAGRA